MIRRALVPLTAAAIAVALSGCASTKMASARPDLDGACVLVMGDDGKPRRATEEEMAEFAGTIRLDARDIDMVRVTGSRIVMRDHVAREPACNASAGNNLG